MTEAKSNGNHQNDQDSTSIYDPPHAKSLIIPITSHLKDRSSSADPDLFIEIFPEELPRYDSSVIIKVLREEDTPLSTYADAALLYVQNRKEREGADVLSAATKMETLCSNKNMRVRVLASAGIAHLTQANKLGNSGSGDKGFLPFGLNSVGGGVGGSGSNALTPQQQAASDQNDELRSMAEDLFNKATNFDQFFPMTWVGKGMLNLSIGRMDAARFFFETTFKQYGQVLPALLGKAAVNFAEKNYKEAQALYGKAMTLYPHTSGAAVRVGFGLCCYKLGQVDRAKAAFKRAYQIDNENVEAMVGCAVLDLASVDDTAKDFLQKTENAIKMMSMANMIDHSNAMVQNHLANHYFWKWSQVTGTISVVQGSNVITSSKSIQLDPGERVRIGQDFETIVIMDEDLDNMDSNNTVFKIKDAWKKASEKGLKLWKKDYDRVFSLAKGAYSSTSVQEIQAESLFILVSNYINRKSSPISSL